MQFAYQRRYPHAAVIRLCSTTRRRGKTWRRVSPTRPGPLAARGTACGSSPSARPFRPPRSGRCARFGQRAFGENYVQEAVAKMDALADLRLTWNGTLSGRCRATRREWPRNASPGSRRSTGPRSPNGSPPRARLACLRSTSAFRSTSAARRRKTASRRPMPSRSRRRWRRCRALRLRGLMGIAEATPVATTRRAQFRILRVLLDQCRAAGLAVDTLSMGMSADLEDAIAEGATLVRVGSALFGQRGTLTPCRAHERRRAAPRRSPPRGKRREATLEGTNERRRAAPRRSPPSGEAARSDTRGGR